MRVLWDGSVREYTSQRRDLFSVSGEDQQGKRFNTGKGNSDKKAWDVRVFRGDINLILDLDISAYPLFNSCCCHVHSNIPGHFRNTVSFSFLTFYFPPPRR